MFDSLLRPPIELRLRDQVLRFDSAADFAFAIEGRTDVCGDDSAALMAMSRDALAAEAEAMEAEETALRGHFEDALSSPSLLSERLAGIDARRWRSEHQWHVLLQALAQREPPHHAINQCALTAYLSYIATRAQLARAILARRPAAVALPVDDDHTATAAREPGRGGPTDRRLPRGQATLVLDADERSVLLRFSEHRHRIRRHPPGALSKGGTVELVDESGKRWAISPGLSCLGRDRSCDIALRAVLKDISRAHAMINLDEHGRVWITDTSSQGTYIVRETAAEDDAEPSV
jgi:hypothetical protein